ncbi:glycoside hydrolase, family 28 [Alkaliphilus metalliredigens QYMF]|uniref:Glycoside hydrolase, family 28 n=1 Tax=Alkaliphilus metalliredigens (strain QYMF) TaxID=293826 RepID=A6TLQ3_ALKMQ|nr:glycoside hydrolase family 28 protein [Alkaliphilus metalliredigens]ABR47121.1 glycoside hydrolase, family 28 [Alkaliphilus metalliredigens QYMF]
MKFEIISITSRTATIEVVGDECVFAKHPFEIYINGSLSGKSNRNVTTISELEPSTEYEIYIKDTQTLSHSGVKVFKTEYESVTLNVKDFGATGTGEKHDTASLQAAIMSCPPSGRVLIPEGTYLTAPLYLKSNITLEIQKGAKLLGSNVREDYPILPGTTKTTDGKDEFYLGSWEGDPMDCFASLLTGIGVNNVKIIGKGIIDGNASFDNWWKDAKKKRVAWRPRLIFIKNCRDILIEEVTVQNSPSWTIHPMFSQNLQLINLKVINPKDSPNTDGINPESCQNVKIIGVDFSVGDDCIAIKSGKLYLGQRLKIASQDIMIRNCHMKFGHGGIVIGSEMAGGVKNVSAIRCIFEETDRGIRIKTRRGRGKDGVINGINAENIVMKKVLTPFVINTFYFCDPDGKTEYVWSKEKLPVDERTPVVKNVYLKNMICEDCEVAAGFIYGLPECKIENIILEDIKVSFALDAKEGYPAMMSHLDKQLRAGFFIGNAKNVKIKNFTVENGMGEPFIFSEVEALSY